jgi:hypothetical protein
MATTIWPYARTENIKFPDIVFSELEPNETESDKGLYSFATNEISSDQHISFKLLTDFPAAVLKNGKDLKQDQVDICVQLTSVESRYQELHILTGEDKLEIDISIPVNLLGNSLQVETFAVLNSNVQESQGYAMRKGDIVGGFSKINISLKDTPARSGADFPTKWESFSSLPETKDTPDALHFMDISSDPILLINDDMSDDLKRIVDSKKSGDEKIFRDNFWLPIAVDSLEQLARHALETSRRNGSIDNLGRIYEQVIQDLAILLTEIADYDDAIEELTAVVLNDDADGEDKFRDLIQTHLPLVAQQHFKIRSTLEKNASKLQEHV